MPCKNPWLIRSRLTQHCLWALIHCLQPPTLWLNLADKASHQPPYTASGAGVVLLNCKLSTHLRKNSWLQGLGLHPCAEYVGLLPAPPPPTHTDMLSQAPTRPVCCDCWVVARLNCTPPTKPQHPPPHHPPCGSILLTKPATSPPAILHVSVA
jgi:hypothetical protein